MAAAQVRISRKRILESAAKIFEMYGTSRAVLEIEYFGEVLPPCPLLSFIMHAMPLDLPSIWERHMRL
jgi:hypothetical protein